MAGPFRRAMRRTALAQIQHVTPVAPKAARLLVAEVYGELERDFGVLAPPIALHSPAPEVLAASWLMLRETLVTAGAAPRPVKEAVASAVSLANACPYCVTVHAATLNSLVHGRDAAAIRDDRFDAIADPEVRAVAIWARSGAFRDGAAEAPAPFPAEQAAELVGVAVTFHYLNRMVNVFLPDAPLPDGVPAASLPVVARVLGTLMRRAAGRWRSGAGSWDLLPAAALPGDLRWAAVGGRAGGPAGEPFGIAEAFARAARVIDEAGAEALSPTVRELVARRLAAWDGKPLGLDRRWLGEAVADLSGADLPAARLALLIALASWQVDQETIDEYRRTAPGDKALIQVASWAALSAARRVGGWIPVPEAGAVGRAELEA
jgi:AhpD family alkylhydroperoxidase